MIGSSGNPQDFLEGDVRYYVRGGEVEKEFQVVEEDERHAAELDPEVRRAAEGLLSVLAGLGLAEVAVAAMANDEAEPDDIRAAQQLIRRYASELGQRRGLPPDYEGFA